MFYLHSVSIHNKKRKVRTFAAPKRVRKKLRMMREQRAQYFSSGMFDFDNSSNDDDDLDFFDDAFALHHASYISQSVSYSNDVDGENVTRTTASCKVKNGTTTQEHVTVERKLGNTRLVTHASRDAQSGQVVVTSKQN